MIIDALLNSDRTKLSRSSITREQVSTVFRNTLEREDLDEENVDFVLKKLVQETNISSVPAELLCQEYEVLEFSYPVYRAHPYGVRDALRVIVNSEYVSDLVRHSGLSLSPASAPRSDTLEEILINVKFLQSVLRSLDRGFRIENQEKVTLLDLTSFVEDQVYQYRYQNQKWMERFRMKHPEIAERYKM